MPTFLLLCLIAAATAPSNRASRRWASIAQTAVYLGVTTRTVRQMVADGRLTQYHLGARLVRIDLDEVDRALVGE